MKARCCFVFFMCILKKVKLSRFRYIINARYRQFVHWQFKCQLSKGWKITFWPRIRTEIRLNHPRITSENKYSKIQDHRGKKVLCRKDMLTHCWDLNEYYLWFGFIRKEKKNNTFLEYNKKFGVRVIRHQWLKIFHSAVLLNQNII